MPLCFAYQALAKCFKSMLVDTDMLQEARQKVRGFHAQYMSDELPAYPTYEVRAVWDVW